MRPRPPPCSIAFWIRLVTTRSREPEIAFDDDGGIGSFEGEFVAAGDRQRGEVGDDGSAQGHEIEMAKARLVMAEALHVQQLFGKAGDPGRIRLQFRPERVRGHRVQPGLQNGDRGPQLVGGIEDEAALALVALVEPLQCTVDRADQRMDFRRHVGPGQTIATPVDIDELGRLRNHGDAGESAADDPGYDDDRHDHEEDEDRDHQQIRQEQDGESHAEDRAFAEHREVAGRSRGAPRHGEIGEGRLAVANVDEVDAVEVARHRPVDRRDFSGLDDFPTAAACHEPEVRRRAAQLDQFPGFLQAQGAVRFTHDRPGCRLGELGIDQEHAFADLQDVGDEGGAEGEQHGDLEQQELDDQPAAQRARPAQFHAQGRSRYPTPRMPWISTPASASASFLRRREMCESKALEAISSS